MIFGKCVSTIWSEVETRIRHLASGIHLVGNLNTVENGEHVLCVLYSMRWETNTIKII